MLIEYIAGIAATFLIMALVWWLVERNDYIPPFMQFKPYNCRTCLTFWLTVGVAIPAWMVGLHLTSLVMGVMALLNAAAMHIDDRNRFSE